MSRSIQARAFTHGNDLYFNSGEYQPHTQEGQRLLAHELTHVVQQEGGRSSQLQRSIELRAPGRGEASAFDRAGELVDRLNQQHPEAITYSLDGNVLRCQVVNEGALTHFDSEMRRFIENEERVIPLRLITRHGLARASADDPFEPVVVDDYDSGYVDLEDLLASEGFAFQSNLIHLLTERFVTSNYARRIGNRFPDAEFDRAHAAGQQAEAAVFRSIFDDPSIRFASQDNLANGTTQVVFFSRAERYTIFMFVRTPGNRLLTTSTVRVRTADRRRTLTVDEFLEERRRARAAAAPAPAPAVLPKLYVNNPADRYEQEADAMADRVMRMSASQAPAQHSQALIGPSVQRKCAQCEEAEKEEGIMRKAADEAGLQAPPSLAAKLAANKGGGSPLPGGTRRFMENAFSADFSRVSIHNDGEAAAMSQSIQAHAFTHGNDIYFNSGRYSPHTQQGQRLLAHELTHTLQQTGGIHRSTGTEAGSGGAPSATAGGTGTGTAGTGGISVDVLAAVNPEDFLVRAAAQELGTDIRVSSMENMIDQLESLVPANGCLASLNIYNHGNPSIQMVAGDNKVKNADGTTSRTPISGFSLSWLSTAANQGALNRLRHLFCCNGAINWYGCSTVGVWAEGGTRTATERSSDAHRYTGTFGDWYQSIPEALARGAFASFRYIGAVNAQMWADATCTTLTASTDFTNWTTRDGRVTRTTAHGGPRYLYSPRAVAACTCDPATNRVGGAAPTATELDTRATQLREDRLRPYYNQYRSVLGRTPTPPPETAAEAQQRQMRARDMQALGQTIRTAVLSSSGLTAAAAPSTSAEALQVVGRWGITAADIVSRLGPLTAATGAAVSGTTSGGSLDAQQSTLEAALTPRGRETFMEMLARVQQERFWANHFAGNTIYVFPDLPPTARYRAYKQEGTRPLPDGTTAPAYIIHMKKEMFDGGQSELATALLVHELSHTLFHGITGEAMSGFLDELANLIADDPQIAALRGSSATPADRDRQVRQIRQLIYDASAYAEEEVFVHLQQLTHMPDVQQGRRALRGVDYIGERLTEFLGQLLRIGLPAAALEQVLRNLVTQTRALYQRRMESMPAGSDERRMLEIYSRLALSTLQLAYDEARNPRPATP